MKKQEGVGWKDVSIHGEIGLAKKKVFLNHMQD
jgi:hypothetical protein